MNLANKTKKELTDELEDLRLRISELEKHGRDYRQALESFGQRANRSFPPLANRQEGLVVVFDRKLEFVNDIFTGLSKDGHKLECETVLLFIPYKWGVAIQCTLNRVSVSRRIDEALKRHYSDLPIAVNDVQTGVLYADRDRLLM